MSRTSRAFRALLAAPLLALALLAPPAAATTAPPPTDPPATIFYDCRAYTSIDSTPCNDSGVVTITGGWAAAMSTTSSGCIGEIDAINISNGATRLYNTASYSYPGTGALPMNQGADGIWRIWLQSLGTNRWVFSYSVFCPGAPGYGSAHGLIYK